MGGRILNFPPIHVGFDCEPQGKFTNAQKQIATTYYENSDSRIVTSSLTIILVFMVSSIAEFLHYIAFFMDFTDIEICILSFIATILRVPT